MDFLGIGPMELFLILILALIVFGPGKLPELARQLGRAVREFRKASSELTHDFKEEFEKELNSEPAKPKETSGGNGAGAGKSDNILIKTTGSESHNANQN
jgi:sec-independent protein translocase protein TatA